MQRREFVKLLGGSLVLMQSPQLAFALDSKAPQKRFIWVMLRGALDPLHTVIPEFDPDYKTLRPTLSRQLAGSTLPLSSGFSLNPNLVNLHKWYWEKELLPIVAVSTGYQGRSHFDGQDYLESGTGTQDVDSGWLGRLMHIQKSDSIAISSTTPISLRGSDRVNSWYPSNFKEANDDILLTLMKMYQGDELLSTHLASGITLKESAMLSANQQRKDSRQFTELATACANLLIQNEQMGCAMLEVGGWDTHNNQHTRLKRQLSQLDAGLAALKLGLGKQWQHTVVAIATEFGRTAIENGTGGTDHGSGSVMFLAGGAVNGGKILGQWPGLSRDNLYQQRDLQPTSNTFSWLASVLSQHWQLTAPQVSQVFANTPVYKTKLIGAYTNPTK
ncbi:DUF1501 domain-containing protein [Shewanella sp. D64]|uniref:DUF1501 domain-containing protein n=1 Tax=unclassified Shewanella TaxID=196818 RepID=UPI0022BA4736|nr:MULTISPECIES: DUF1501 domain-containing protein [unclassified Shewanella]MEC4724684.1 DUF1501 domain-containing protein [Shewanella sp. D64]MEC4736522.1 DUF1501 domain-containing protein [Shewanella sp. E94]WBJ97425.1 DUF1501 domain-containing protein [Shewanella sp. MTB7]